LVIDAIDTYNERWEKECKIQEAARLDYERQEELAKEEMKKTSKDAREKAPDTDASHFLIFVAEGVNNANFLETR
jgi:molybdopterin synthase catalytic subunit